MEAILASVHIGAGGWSHLASSPAPFPAFKLVMGLEPWQLLLWNGLKCTNTTSWKYVMHSKQEYLEFFLLLYQFHTSRQYTRTYFWGLFFLSKGYWKNIHIWKVLLSPSFKSGTKFLFFHHLHSKWHPFLCALHLLWLIKTPHNVSPYASPRPSS